MRERPPSRVGPSTFPEVLDARLASHPAAVAFHREDGDLTYAEFSDLYRRAVGWLEAHDVRAGDRVAVWLPNRVEWIALFFAIAHVGATLVCVNTRYRSDEIGHILSRSGAKLLIMQERLRNIDFAEILSGVDLSAAALTAVAVLDGPRGRDRILGRPAVPFDPSVPSATPPSRDREATVILFTTSGTTRGPKLVMHPQRTLVDHAFDCAGAYGLGLPGACLLAALPFCGVFGLNAALAALAAGAPIVTTASFDAPHAAALMARHAVTHVFGSDEMFRKLIDAAPGERPYPSARLFGFGAFTSSFMDYARDACRRGLPMTGLYGSSEVLALFSAQDLSAPLEDRLQGGGMPAAGGARVRVRDVETGELAAVGERGEVEILAPSNFTGYLDDDAATREAVREDGYFRTGDVGYERADGSFVFEARMGDAMRLGGFLVNPVEIEDVLKRMDGVADAQVVAVPVDRQVRAVAFVVPSLGRALRDSELVREAKAMIAPFKVPARIWFVDRYPMTQSSNGLKTQRNKLREMACARLREEAERAAAGACSGRQPTEPAAVAPVGRPGPV